MRLFRCPNQHAEEYNSIRGASYAVLKGLRGVLEEEGWVLGALGRLLGG